MKINFKIIVVFFMLPLLFNGCSRKKNSFSRRAFHNTTSHYNYYFNARELLRAHLENIENNYTYDYNYLLPIFFYGTEAQATGSYDDMEEIVKKCSKLIDRHSMYIKKEEYNRWIDESYILVAKAKFYRREYYGALEVLEYVTYAYRDQPSYFEAKIWIARTYMQMEDLREAEDILETIKEGDLPAKHKSEYYALYADLYVQQDDLEQAAFYLKSAVENESELKTRRKYTYILAQIYHELKNYGEATKYYGKVLKMRPDYRMSFNSKLNQARSYDVSAQNSDEIKRRLDRMLRDKKNTEFRDQIYFALAELAFREDDEPMGMEYLRLCASTSISNNKVKSEAYMLLGDIFYDKPKYIIAHSYYDSCMTVIPESHPKLERTEERKESLDDLVGNLLTIEREDSLQKMAQMDEKERDKMIRKIIRKVEREEELKEEQLARSFAQSYELANKRDDGGQIGQWYFYNQSVKSFGVSEFKKTWGNRPLEDNWRRSDKGSVLKFSNNIVDSAITDTANNGLTEKDPEFYLNQLPLDDSSMGVSHNKIIYSLYSAGNIFREQFEDYGSAIECFDRLVEDYDTCRYVESSYYQLYRIYLIIEEGDKANEYRNLILNKYPFSEYARIIKNPEYLKNKRDKNEQVEAYYTATYKLFGYKMYGDVIDACKKSDDLFGDHHMKPQFDYLEALAIGKSQSRANFKMALEEVVAKYPSEDVAKSAQNILDKMNDMTVQKEKREALYKKNFRDDHVLVVMSPNLSTTVEEVKTAISDYNINSQGSGKLKVSSVVFNGNYQMISVKNFKGKDEGLLYLSNLEQYPEFKSKVKEMKYDYFIISTENFAYFYQQKDLESYLEFYNEHYFGD